MKPTNLLSVFAVVRSDELRQALVSAIAPHNGTELSVEVGHLKVLGSRFNGGAHPNILLFDVDVDDPEDLEALKRIRNEQAKGKTAIIATSDKLTTSVMRRLLRDGIDDFLPQPLSVAEVSETLQAVERKLQESERTTDTSGAVFSFLKASGGMGATTLAVHTACALARRKRKEAPKRVCLIDLDVQFGSAGLYLDLDSNSALVDIVRSPERLDAELLQGVVAQHRSGFDVLTSPSLPMPLDALHSEIVFQLLNLVQQEYDYVVVDLPHALTHWTDAVLTRSSMIALVTQLNVPAIRQTRKLLELLQEEGHYSLPVALVLNRYQKRWGSGVHLRQAQKALGRGFDYVVPNDYKLVMAALNQGVPTFDIKRWSRFGKAIRSMAERSVKGLGSKQQPTSLPAAEVNSSEGRKS